jgi:protein phosphatase 2C family protein 2/3
VFLQGSDEPSPLIAQPEVLHERMSPLDEFVVLACDGVWDVMSPEQVVHYVRRRLLQHGDPQQAAEELTQKALDLNSIDNVSAIVVRFPRMKVL